MKQKNKKLDLTIVVLDHSNPTFPPSLDSISVGDSLEKIDELFQDSILLKENSIVVDGRVAAQAVAYWLESQGSSNILHDVEVVGPKHGQFDPFAVLSSLSSKFAEDNCSLDLRQCLVSAESFTNLTEHWEFVCLSSCNLADGWAVRPSDSARCSWLLIRGCRSQSQIASENISWPALRAIQTLDNQEAGSLAEICYRDDLEFIAVDNEADISFLLQMPPSPNLRDMRLTGISADLIAYLARLPKLRSLTVEGEILPELPWHLLKNIRSLNVSSSSLMDGDVEHLTNLRMLRCLSLYYTKVTAASWAKILAMPKLSQLWVGTTMLSGPIPTELPQNTNLKEVVTLNVGEKHSQWLLQLLKRIPGVAVCDM